MKIKNLRAGSISRKNISSDPALKLEDILIILMFATVDETAMSPLFEPTLQFWDVTKNESAGSIWFDVLGKELVNAILDENTISLRKFHEVSVNWDPDETSPLESAVSTILAPNTILELKIKDEKVFAKVKMTYGDQHYESERELDRWLLDKICYTTATSTA